MVAHSAVWSTMHAWLIFNSEKFLVPNKSCRLDVQATKLHGDLWQARSPCTAVVIAWRQCVEGLGIDSHAHCEWFSVFNIGWYGLTNNLMAKWKLCVHQPFKGVNFWLLLNFTGISKVYHTRPKFETPSSSMWVNYRLIRLTNKDKCFFR